MDNDRLTEPAHWDATWERIKLPSEVSRRDANPLAREILSTFDRFLPHQAGLSILEIGGAPGQFLAYFAKEFGYKVNALDYSEVGCAKTRENFSLLGRDVQVYQKDLFADLSDLPRFDLVFSSGFLEHFIDLDAVIGKHVELLKEDGILVIGVPNFRGISRIVLKRLAPKLLSMHNLEAMDIGKWQSFETKFCLKTIFKGYIGGFEPRNFRRCENRNLRNRLIRLLFKPIRLLLTDRFRFLRRFNSPYWSAYLLGIYRKRGTDIALVTAEKTSGVCQ